MREQESLIKDYAHTLIRKLNEEIDNANQGRVNLLDWYSCTSCLPYLLHIADVFRISHLISLVISHSASRLEDWKLASFIFGRATFFESANNWRTPRHS